MSRFAGRIAVVTALIIVTAATELQAQLSEQDRARLVLEMRDAASRMDADRIPQLDSAQQDLLANVAALHRYLETATSAENRDAWLTYLDLDPLIELIQSDDSPSKQLREAVALQHRLVGVAPGLEYPRFVAVRDAVNRLVPAIRFRDRERSSKLIARQLESLVEKFEQLDAVPSADDASTADQIVNLLAQANQQAPLTDSLRSLFNQPNVAVWVDEGFVQEVANQKIDESQPVRDYILGTRITGTAYMNGGVQAALLPAYGSVRLRVTLSGQVSSRNIGYNGPIRIHSASQAGICATRVMNIAESGITLEPTFAQANMQTQLLAIDHRLRLVRRIAWRKAHEMKPQADRIALNHMEQRLGEQFTKKTGEVAAGPMPDVMAKVRPVLTRLEMPEPPRYLASTDQVIVLRSLLRRADQIGSPVPAPPLASNYAVAVQVHESAINNSLGRLLAGRKMTEQKLNDLLSQAGRELPKPQDGETDQDEPPFEINFSRVRPITFEARDGALKVGIRGTRFAQGRRELARPLEITATYMPATLNGKAILVREGKVRIDFPGSKRLTVSQAGLRRTIEKKFADVFPTMLLDRPMTVPADVRVQALANRTFRPSLIDAADGWLTLAVR